MCPWNVLMLVDVSTSVTGTCLLYASLPVLLLKIIKQVQVVFAYYGHVSTHYLQVVHVFLYFLAIERVPSLKRLSCHRKFQACWIFCDRVVWSHDLKQVQFSFVRNFWCFLHRFTFISSLYYGKRLFQSMSQLYCHILKALTSFPLCHQIDSLSSVLLLQCHVLLV